MYEGVLVVHVVLAALLIGLVLLQQGKGGGMGTAFGSGAETLLSTPGAGNILSRGTAIIAALFFVTSLSLGYLASQKSKAMNEALVPAAIPQPDTVLMTAPTAEETAAPAPAENINQGAEQKPQIP